jgi:hypothetical protein
VYCTDILENTPFPGILADFIWYEKHEKGPRLKRGKI